MSLGARRAARVRRRRDPEPDALRVPGAVDQGARLRRQHHDTPATMRREALAYGAGVLADVRRARAALLLALRAAGEQLGWGFQLQSPAVRRRCWRCCSSLLGAEPGRACSSSATLRRSVAAQLDARSTARSTRSPTGVLAVVVASPCTAPFMGAALGFALAQPAPQTLAVFAALGVGMALPYVAAGVVPALAARAAAAGRLDGALQAGAGVPAVRHRRVARLGARRSSSTSTRCCALAIALVARGARAVGLARVARPRRRAAAWTRSRWRSAPALVVVALAAGRRRRRRAGPQRRSPRPPTAAGRRYDARARGRRSPPTAGRCSSTSPPPGA